MTKSKTKDPEQRVWDAYVRYLQSIGGLHDKPIRITEAFRAGFLAAEATLAADAARVARAQNELDEGRPVPKHGSGP